MAAVSQIFVVAGLSYTQIGLRPQIGIKLFFECETLVKLVTLKLGQKHSTMRRSYSLLLSVSFTISGQSCEDNRCVLGVFPM